MLPFLFSSSILAFSILHFIWSAGMGLAALGIFIWLFLRVFVSLFKVPDPTWTAEAVSTLFFKSATLSVSISKKKITNTGIP